MQICREFGWTQDELDAADDDFVWAAMNILHLEGEKQEAERRRNDPSSRFSRPPGM